VRVMSIKVLVDGTESIEWAESYAQRLAREYPGTEVAIELADGPLVSPCYRAETEDGLAVSDARGIRTYSPLGVLDAELQDLIRRVEDISLGCPA
jgi:hypothetical protein